MGLLQNVKVKVFLQNTVFVLLTILNRYTKHNPNVVLFYINTDLRESNKSLLEYMIRHNYQKKYRIICSCNDPEKYKDKKIENVKFTGRLGGIICFFKSSKVFYSIGKIPIEPAKDQTVMQMWHGTPIKNANEGWRKNHTWKHQHYTYLLCPSKHYAPVFSNLFSVPISKIYIGGYPRCDVLFKGSPNYNLGNYKKLIVWFPTFRKSNDHGLKELENCDVIVPVIKRKDFDYIDSFLKKIGVKVILKLHPMQEIGDFALTQMDYFRLLSHNDFLSQGMDIYGLCSQSDAMITDYSSICFDYLLLNRPIAFTEDDMEMYKEGRGFVFDNMDEYKPGFRIKDINDFKKFCLDVAEDVDNYQKERNRVLKLTNDYCDGKFCKRVLEKMQI